MAQLPEDFLSAKSFKSLTGNAFMAWLVIMIIDVIFIAPLNDPIAQAKWIWIIGLAVCLVLAVIRLYFKEEKEKGDKLLLVFNAALIFLYASGMNGFTKELGGWDEIRKSGTDEKMVVELAPVSRQDILGAALAWVPGLLGKQSSYWPDPELIAENRKLQQTIKRLDTGNLQPTMDALEAENSRLRDSVKIMEDAISNIKSTQTTSNNENVAYYKTVIDTLTNRIISFNSFQSTWQNVDPIKRSKTADLIMRVTDNTSFYQILFLTPINAQWPPNNK